MSYERRWMLFVDGENLTMRAQAVAQEQGLTLNECRLFERDVYIWFDAGPAVRQMSFSYGPHTPLEGAAVRAHYYTSVVGDEDRRIAVSERLLSIGFNPTSSRSPRWASRARAWTSLSPRTF